MQQTRVRRRRSWAKFQSVHVEDAADHPERSVHTHLEYGRPDDLPPCFGAGELDEEGAEGRLRTNTDEVDVEDLPDEKTA